MSAVFLTTPRLAALRGLKHGFFTRQGGVSAGGFASLNCSLSGKDEIGRVRQNRALAVAALGLAGAPLFGVFQTHGTATAVLEGDGWGEAGRPEADALVTRRRGAVLGIVTADCTPVLFADIAAGVIGAAHAGWRGAVAGILESTVAAMVKLGAEPGRIVAAIGPCIRQPSYEVGADLHAAVLAREAADTRFFAPGRRDGHWQFDLAGYCAAQLAAMGLGTVEDCGADTLAEETRFFSHRRNTLAKGGAIGHQLSAIALAE